ncbi:hypothetical protein D3C78_1813630 [compost metagenome]
MVMAMMTETRIRNVMTEARRPPVSPSRRTATRWPSVMEPPSDCVACCSSAGERVVTKTKFKSKYMIVTAPSPRNIARGTFLTGSFTWEAR